MTRPFSITPEAIERIIERDQTSTTLRTQAEQIATKYECAIGMTKQVGFPYIQERGAELVREYEIQLRGLAEFADEYAEAFHIEADEQAEEIQWVCDKWLDVGLLIEEGADNRPSTQWREHGYF